MLKKTMDRKQFIKQTALLSVAPFLPLPNLFHFRAMTTEPVQATPSLENSYWYIGHLMSILISSEQTNGAFSLIHGFEIQGLEPPPHTHTREDESFYLINGEINYLVGDRVIQAKPGDWVFLPRGIQHTFQVITEQAEVLMHLTPGGFENYFIDMSVPAEELVIPPRPQGPPDVQRIIETASRYGIKFPER